MRTVVQSLLIVASAVGALAPRSAPADCEQGRCYAAPLSPFQVDGAGLQVDGRAIARVANQLGGASSLGTGTLVEVQASRGVVLTCAHLFREGMGTLTVHFAGGQVSAARLLRIDAAADLAALEVAAPPVRPIEIADRSPQPGEPLVSCGLGSDGRLWCNRGHALGYVTVLGRQGTETLELSGSARQGDSGGPVFDGEHRLVGVIFGTNGQVVDATYCGRVRKFLAGLCPRLGGRKRGSAAKPPKTIVEPTPPLGPVPDQGHGQSPNHGGPADVAPPPIVNGAPDRSDALRQGADALESVARPWLSAKLAALLVSLGIPGGVAGVLAATTVWLVMRRGKRRLEARLEQLNTGRSLPQAPGAPDIVPSVIERHHNQFVPYEVTALDKAWAAAHAQVGERYPGAVPYLKLVEGVKDQLLSGNSDSKLL